MKKKTSQPRSAKARISHDDPWRVVRFPQVRGKTIRSLRFLHREHASVLTIHFTDRSFLSFDINPEPLFLPMDVSAGYVTQAAGKTRVREWRGMARKE